MSDMQLTRTADRVFGSPDALDNVDSVLVGMIAEHVRIFPALGKARTVALAAIVALSEHDPELARSLMVELS